MATKTAYEWATLQDILEWLNRDIYEIEDMDVYKGVKIKKGNLVLSKTINKRRGSERGDERVDLFYGGKRRTVNISWLVWMKSNGEVLPDGWEIHHIDNDPLNNHPDNLI